MNLILRSQKSEVRSQKEICLLFSVICPLLSFWFLVLGICISSYSQEVLIEEILKNPYLYHTKKVTFIGEVVGEPLKENEGIWINVSYEGFNIGVYFDNPSLVKNIERFGSYGAKGDTVKIEGFFYDSCPLHFERDIHAHNLEIVTRGFPLKESVSFKKEITSFILAIICLILAFVYLIKLRYVSKD